MLSFRQNFYSLLMDLYAVKDNGYMTDIYVTMMGPP